MPKEHKKGRNVKQCSASQKVGALKSGEGKQKQRVKKQKETKKSVRPQEAVRGECQKGRVKRKPEIVAKVC